eukprot:gene7691-854_t
MACASKHREAVWEKLRGFVICLHGHQVALDSIRRPQSQLTAPHGMHVHVEATAGSGSASWASKGALDTAGCKLCALESPCSNVPHRVTGVSHGVHRIPTSAAKPLSPLDQLHVADDRHVAEHSLVDEPFLGSLAPMAPAQPPAWRERENLPRSKPVVDEAHRTSGARDRLPRVEGEHKDAGHGEWIGGGDPPSGKRRVQDGASPAGSSRDHGLRSKQVQEEAGHMGGAREWTPLRQAPRPEMEQTGKLKEAPTLEALDSLASNHTLNPIHVSALATRAAALGMRLDQRYQATAILDRHCVKLAYMAGPKGRSSPQNYSEGSIRMGGRASAREEHAWTFRELADVMWAHGLLGHPPSKDLNKEVLARLFSTPMEGLNRNAPAGSTAPDLTHKWELIMLAAARKMAKFDPASLSAMLRALGTVKIKAVCSSQEDSTLLSELALSSSKADRTLLSELVLGAALHMKEHLSDFSDSDLTTTAKALLKLMKLTEDSRLFQEAAYLSLMTQSPHPRDHEGGKYGSAGIGL